MDFRYDSFLSVHMVDSFVIVKKWIDRYDSFLSVHVVDSFVIQKNWISFTAIWLDILPFCVC